MQHDVSARVKSQHYISLDESQVSAELGSFSMVVNKQRKTKYSEIETDSQTGNYYQIEMGQELTAILTDL